ncbi:MAG: DivIVA domain-containing protein [Actinomycetes bacterium]
MDVTPHELRDVEIKEVRRGYDCDAVDTILERAAATIESLQEQLHLAEQHARDVEVTGSAARQDEDVLQRTLLLATKAADEAVAEANAKARAITEAAEAQARAAVEEATATAQREANAQRVTLEAEVGALSSRRDALSADVDALERFESDYRDRLRRAIQADLDTLSASKEPVGSAARPRIHDLGDAAPAAPEPAATGGPVTEEISAVAPASSESDAAVEANAGTGDAEDPAPVLFETAPTPESMDDDEFFASLREAVNDDTPLGPRDDDIPERAMFPEERRSGIFRRKR